MAKDENCNKLLLQSRRIGRFVFLNLAIYSFRVLGAFIVVGTAAGASATDYNHYKSGKAKHSYKFTNHFIPL